MKYFILKYAKQLEADINSQYLNQFRQLQIFSLMLA